MKQYIDKSALIAEINKRLEKIANASSENNRELSAIYGAQQYELINLSLFINSLEVKEVNLEKEIELIKGDYEQVDVAWNNDFDFIARHFFELGLKAKNKKFECWLSIKEYSLERFVEVLAYNKEWVDEDKCPNGIRIGFLAEDGFISATWNMEHDCYDTVYEEGDDYYKGNVYVIEEEQKRALPNMPTHYMIIPNYKAQKGE